MYLNYQIVDTRLRCPQSLCFDRQDNGLQQQNQNQHDGIQQHEQHEPYATCQNRKW